jgi:uncharacterized protein (TIGR03435 family)
VVIAASAVAGAQTPKYAYEATVITPFDSVENRISFHMNLDNFEASGFTLQMLVQFAYGKTFGDEVTGIPPELKGKRWSIHAKADAETAEAIKKLKLEDSTKAEREMLLGMLEDRFKLKSHMTTKEGPVYMLVPAKGGPKLTEVAKDADAASGPKDADGKPKGGSIETRNGLVEASNIPIAGLTSLLQNQLQRKVEDHTGLKGRYDFTLRWSGEGEGGKAAGEDDNAPALETAIQEQLGFKLENGRGPVDVIVVDHAEMPGEN